MPISHISRFRLNRIGTIALFWSVIGIWAPVNQHLNFLNYPGILESEALKDYSLLQLIGTSVLATFFGALLFGFLEEFFFRRTLRRKSFHSIFFWKLTIYASLVISLNILGSFFYNSFQQSRSPFHRAVMNEVWGYVTTAPFYSTVLLYLALIMVTILILQINDRFGQGMLLNFMRGSYYSPKDEHRAFMFLDIKSSTALAESLGNTLYFRLLNDFFEDLADPVTEYRGVIYQYVGDEVVITWKEKYIDLSIPCFFAIRNKIFRHAKKYKIRYGVVPQFKAGLHYGQVTIGEVGVHRRDIIFSGDVLNTASRIQSMCNDLDQKFLITEALKEKIVDEDPFSFSEMGEFTLKGKKEALKLYGVSL